MSQADFLRQQYEEAKVNNERAQAVYQSLLAQKMELETELRAACDVSSEASNVLAGLAVAVSHLPAPTPAPTTVEANEAAS